MKKDLLKEAAGSTITVQTTINELQQVYGEIVAIAPTLPFTERMNMAALGRVIKSKIDDFNETIEKQDLTTYHQALQAAREKYAKTEKPGSMEQMLKDIEVVERSNKAKIDKFKMLQKQIEADVRKPLTIEVVPIPRAIFENETIKVSQPALEVLMPFIA